MGVAPAPGCSRSGPHRPPATPANAPHFCHTYRLSPSHSLPVDTHTCRTSALRLPGARCQAAARAGARASRPHLHTAFPASPAPASAARHRQLRLHTSANLLSFLFGGNKDGGMGGQSSKGGKGWAPRTGG